MRLYQGGLGKLDKAKKWGSVCEVDFPVGLKIKEVETAILLMFQQSVPSLRIKRGIAICGYKICEMMVAIGLNR